MYSTSVTILIATLAVILLSARHYQIASDYSGQVARAVTLSVISKTSFYHKDVMCNATERVIKYQSILEHSKSEGNQQ